MKLSHALSLVILTFFLAACRTGPAVSDAAIRIGELGPDGPTLVIDQNSAKILFQDQFGAVNVADVELTSEVADDKRTYFLFARGNVLSGERSYRRAIMRFPAFVTRNGIYLRERDELFGESCTPIGESACAFEPGGGCECIEPTGAVATDDSCNHTVVRGRMSR
ncbi:hypothetical protein [Lewinella sp. IMCC34183]|uniref:hypothetical protein n=1 Tax=Lewinella sp. IMCC34183 TaxID=2248762 RepID=UPI000E22D8AD|nr:hypothetical protein [Lewinella sp. IMCC34183]